MLGLLLATTSSTVLPGLPACEIPALLTNKLSFPNCVWIFSKAADMVFCLVTSNSIAIALLPSWDAAFIPFSRFLAPTKTV
ncbi:hypothetical protein D3C72_2255620 [compost metagenome]